MMIAAMVLITFNTVFWTLFEQAGSSLTLFADRNTDLSVFGLFSISAGQTQFFNAAFIVLLAPLFSMLWNGLARRGIEPPIPIKFGLALMGVGAGFLFLVWGAQFAGPDFKVGLWWLAGLYLIHSVAELCISPVGLSMITKLSIARIVGMMMGVWFLSIAVAQYVAGLVAQVASVETVGGQVTNLQVSLNTYVGVFTTIGLDIGGDRRGPAGPQLAAQISDAWSEVGDAGGAGSDPRRWVGGMCGATPPAKPKPGAIRINENPYPSTYQPYGGVPTLIRNATVLDGEGGRIDNGSVLLVDGKVQAVGGADLAAPEGATVIDARRPLCHARHHRYPQPPGRLSFARRAVAERRQ